MMTVKEVKALLKRPATLYGPALECFVAVRVTPNDVNYLQVSKKDVARLFRGMPDDMVTTCVYDHGTVELTVD